MNQTIPKKLNEVITILLSEENIENENPILLLKSQATDYKGFSQTEIEKILKAESLVKEIINFKILLAEIRRNKGELRFFHPSN